MLLFELGLKRNRRTTILAFAMQIPRKYRMMWAVVIARPTRLAGILRYIGFLIDSDGFRRTCLYADSTSGAYTSVNTQSIFLCKYAK